MFQLYYCVAGAEWDGGGERRQEPSSGDAAAPVAGGGASAEPVGHRRRRGGSVAAPEPPAHLGPAQSSRRRMHLPRCHLRLQPTTRGRHQGATT